MSLSATLSEIEQIFIQLELDKIDTLCVTADKSGAGATSVAMALTERYLLAGYKTLLVDFNLFNPSFDAFVLPSKTQVEGSTPEFIRHNQSQHFFSGIQAPATLERQLAFRDPISLMKSIEKWQTEYDKIIVDTTALNQCNQSNIPTVTIANVVQGTLLVVSAGKSNSSDLKAATALLKKAHANVCGIILNQHQQNTLAQDIANIISRLPFVGSRASSKIKSYLTRSSLFRYGV